MIVEEYSVVQPDNTDLLALGHLHSCLLALQVVDKTIGYLVVQESTAIALRIAHLERDRDDTHSYILLVHRATSR